MFRMGFAIAMCLVLVAGCQKPSSDSPPANPSGSASPAALSEKTVGSVVLKPMTVLDGTLSLLIPEGFVPMDEEMLRVKYPREKRPSLAFTNDRGTVNIAINHTQDRVSPGQLKELHQSLDNSIRQQIPQANWLFSGFQIYQGREWVQLEFVSPAIDTKIHNIMATTSANDRMLIVSFNTTSELEPEWLEPGREIIKSMVVNRP